MALLIQAPEQDVPCCCHGDPQRLPSPTVPCDYGGCVRHLTGNQEPRIVESLLETNAILLPRRFSLQSEHLLPEEGGERHALGPRRMPEHKL
ncbi:hypothetical protein NDU88_006807 [Pleurodeles waltl]|uniref:Uncharacterized protein n=1 Tax=Pleurodeles waltl TaxID=8319 RepID=A0AAV7WBT7_PLEWA|nr:hypothetical protein NDU88_006807 [Pleurodeles waltl]